MAAYKCLYFSSTKNNPHYVTLPQTDYQDSVTFASVVNPTFYQRQNLPQFGNK